MPIELSHAGLIYPWSAFSTHSETLRSVLVVQRSNRWRSASRSSNFPHSPSHDIRAALSTRESLVFRCSFTFMIHSIVFSFVFFFVLASPLSWTFSWMKRLPPKRCELLRSDDSARGSRVSAKMFWITSLAERGERASEWRSGFERKAQQVR